MSSASVQHHPAQSRFELSCEGKIAFAEYEQRGGVVVLTHTWVPPEIRGGGVAGHLVRAALLWARDQNKKVVPQCSYVDTYLRRHPEFADLRA